MLKKLLLFLLLVALFTSCQKQDTGTIFAGKILEGNNLNREGDSLLNIRDNLLSGMDSLIMVRVRMVEKVGTALYISDQRTYSLDSLQSVEIEYIFKELRRLEDLINGYDASGRR